MNVLVVDDEYVIQMGLKSCLEKLENVQCEVRTAGSAGRALELLAEQPADLMITDISMPKMSGLELIDEVNRRKLCRHCVILSGYEEFEYARRALRSGVSEYLLKPVDRGELGRVVTAVAYDASREEDLSLLTPFAAHFSHLQEEAPPPLRKIVRYIREHYNTDISLSALSELSGKSEGYICSQFKKEWNIGYMDFVSELRLREALYLLLYRPALSVSAVAGLVGYSTERQLFRLLRGQLDMTPQQVREHSEKQ